MHSVELVCPYCTGRFPVEPAGASRTSTCPHCGRSVTVPATPPAPPPPVTPPPPAPPVPPPPPPPLHVWEGEAPAEPLAELLAGSAGASPSPNAADEATAAAPSAMKDDEPPPASPASPFAVRESTHTVVNRRGEAIPLRRLAPEERQRYRRRLNLVFALAGLVVLAIAVAVLLHVRP